MLGVALALGILLGGCSIVETIDDIGKDTKAEAKAPTPPSGEAQLPDVPEGSNQAKLRAYYNRRSKPAAEEDPANPIVGCRVSSGIQFMRRHDCTLRGGREV